MQVRFGWMKKNLAGKKGQQGFTLIELLVVVTILGILAGIVTLSLVGLTTNANVQSCNSEYKTVQAALDAYMANNNLDTIPSVADSNNMNQVIPLYNASPSGSSPNYTRNQFTQFYYSWDTHGKIIDIFSDAGTIPKAAPGIAPFNCRPL